jgi:site-specific recombinase XerD
VEVIDPALKQGTSIAQSIANYVAFIKENRRHKTWRAYTANLAYFAEFCTVRGIDTVEELTGEKELILKFPKFVVSKGLEANTAYHKFATVMFLLKSEGVRTGIKKADWPEYTDRDVEAYSHEELTAMFKVANEEERLVLKSFLLSGFRSGELAHLSYECIEFDSSVWRTHCHEIRIRSPIGRNQDRPRFRRRGDPGAVD